MTSINRPHRILALDASTEALSVALFNSERPDALAEHFEITPRAHATRLLPEAQALLDRHGFELSHIDAIAFGRGPGAFTGLRIASGLVQGLARGAGCPVVPVSTLEALAYRAINVEPASTRVRVVQDARMGEIYTADFDVVQGLPVLCGEERVITPADLAADSSRDMGLAGNGWGLVDQALAEHVTACDCTLPHASDIARLASIAYLAGRTVAADQALPVYIRDDVARKSAKPATTRA